MLLCNLVEVIKISNQSRSLIAYTFSHFSVDFTCFFILFYGFKNSVGSLDSVTVGFLIYNVIAFGLQPIIGFICDNNPKIPIGIIGCCTVMFGLLALSFPWASLVLCALGNACFHIGGGIDSLRFANGKMFRSGVFVSTGAIGVALGTMIGQSEKAAIYLPLALIIASITLLIIFSQKTDLAVPCTFKISSDLPLMAVMIFALAAIVIRSYVGGVIPMAWKTNTYLMVLPSISACAGKALGGIIGDKFGAKRVGVSTLLLSIPFLCFGKNIVLISAIGIILFNITMPITLCAVASKFPYNPGLAFGLTTLALLCGNVPAFFFGVSQNLVFPVLIALIVLSAICTLLSTRNMNGGKPYEKNIQKTEQHII
jgi:hypothetical protein